ncbi:thiolase-like protein [Coniochaeta sp. 2T2.1]|nr:thiolase-like protein [Coniochaeta sp. 2T2.1]
MDPQQRILLETAYRALENAGLPVEYLKGSDTSVFVGVYARDYDRRGYKDLPQMSKHHSTGTGEAVLSKRISVSALTQACLTLRAGESRVSIAAGVELLLHPDQAHDPAGRCYVFDERGSGYARGEGVGAVILKRLDHALADGDSVHAVIVNSALNQDGKTPGITLPSADSQAALMRHVYGAVGMNPADTLYVEAHGTGTQAGDAAEISSIARVFSEGKNRTRDLYVGLVKSNVGHLEAASGMAGLIKSIMILKKGLIPPNLDFVTPKPGLNLNGRNIQGPKRVSMNSFGYGGTNGHIVLESVEDSLSRIGHVKGDGHQPPPLAGRRQTRPAYAELASLSYTLGCRRSIFSWRRAVVASPSTNLTFVFTGQGAQWFGMGRQLLDSSACFRASIAASDEMLTTLGADWALDEELCRDEVQSRVGQSEVFQPVATTAIQIALTDLFAGVGIRPSFVVGHSSGEIAAAYASGALSHESAMKISYLRGVISAAAKHEKYVKGAMLAAGSGPEAIAPFVKEVNLAGAGSIRVACINSPESVTISGDEPAVDKLEQLLKEAGVFARKLKVDTAYHSHHMESISQRNILYGRVT